MKVRPLGVELFHADGQTGMTKLIVPFCNFPTAHTNTKCHPVQRIVNSTVGRGSAVGIATRYRLDAPGIESRWGQDFPHRSRPALGPTQPRIQWMLGLSRRQSGRGVTLTPTPI
jgi:hypothetical protein